jgi:hypothetical protein
LTFAQDSIESHDTPMKITQIAVVVRDIEAALKTYTSPA